MADEVEKDPTMGGAPEVEDFSILKQALQNVKAVLTPYDWIEFAQEYETARALRTRMEREDRQRKIVSGEDSDDEPIPEDELEVKKKMERLAHAEHLKSRIVEVQNYFSDVIHSLMQCHGHITNDVKNAEVFIEVMRFVPKNSRDAVERLTEKNAELTRQIQEFEKKMEEIAEYQEKRQNMLLQRHQAAFEKRKTNNLIKTCFTAMRCDCQTSWMNRHREEVQALRAETKDQKKQIKRLDDELDAVTKLLDSFKAKHEKQVKVAAEQLAKLQAMEENLEKLTGKIRLLEQEKRSLEISLKDEVSRRKDAEYGLERTQEELTRKVEEFQDLSDRFDELTAKANQLQKDLLQTQKDLQTEKEERALEKQDMDKAMKKLTKKYNKLQQEYDEFEKETTAKLSDLTSKVSYLVNENETLSKRVKHLEWEVQDTIRQWHENVAQVKKEAAEELERRSKEIYSAFAAERETHLRRLKIQNYELQNRDLYVNEALDLNPLPVPEFHSVLSAVEEEIGEDESGNPRKNKGGLFCKACRRAVVFIDQKDKKLMEMWTPEPKKEVTSPKDKTFNMQLKSVSPRSRKSPERGILSPMISPNRARSLSNGRNPGIRAQTEATFRTRPSVHKA
ncbi:unnamed protein product [Amoebophrya sp. A120]|nr:unnamed protein product [Amoebophrya sp. A120]|eukprot:GSA120T00013582001.1